MYWYVPVQTRFIPKTLFLYNWSRFQMSESLRQRARKLIYCPARVSRLTTEWAGVPGLLPVAGNQGVPSNRQGFCMATKGFQAADQEDQDTRGTE